MSPDIGEFCLCKMCCMVNDIKMYAYFHTRKVNSGKYLMLRGFKRAFKWVLLFSIVH